MKNSLKNKLKTQYEHRTETPSDDLWERIESQLQRSTEEETEIPVVKRFSRLPFWRVAAAVFIFVSVGYLITQVMQKPEKNEAVMAHQEKAANPESNFASAQKEALPKYAGENPEKGNQTEARAISVSEKEGNRIIMKSEPKNIEAAIAQNSKDETTTEIPFNAEKNYLKEPVTQKNEGAKNKVKYVTAQDLLFEREAGKSLREQENDTRKLGDVGLKIEKPKSVKILGVTVYSDEEP